MSTKPSEPSAYCMFLKASMSVSQKLGLLRKENKTQEKLNAGEKKLETFSPYENGDQCILWYHTISCLPNYTPFLFAFFPFCFYMSSQMDQRESKTAGESCLTLPCRTSCLEVQKLGYQRRCVWVNQGRHHRGHGLTPSLHTLGIIFSQTCFTTSRSSFNKVEGWSSLHTEREEAWYESLSPSEFHAWLMMS